MNTLRLVAKAIDACEMYSISTTRSLRSTLAGFILVFLSILSHSDSHAQGGITCLGNVEISVNAWCQVELVKNQFTNNASGEFDIEIVGTSISGALPLTIDSDLFDFNTAYTYKLTDENGLTCDHGTVTFRDFFGPTCGAFDLIVTTSCVDDDPESNFTGPQFEDCSGNVAVFYTDDIQESCDLIFYGGQKVVKIITRTWTAEDQFGNESQGACSQSLYILSPDIDDVHVDEEVFIPCVKGQDLLAAIEPAALSETASPHFVYGEDIHSFNVLCKFAISKTDSDLVPYAGNKFKLFRDWHIVNWCTSQSKTVRQTIYFVDDISPSLTIPDSIFFEANVFSSNPWELCSSIGQLPTAVASDNCTEDENITITAYIPSINRNLQNGGIVNDGLPLGNHDVIYTATDQCGNATTDTLLIKVVDTTKPIAICTPAKNVAITNGGMASVLAGEFENGSSDNCCIDRYEVRRADDPDGDDGFSASVTFGCADDQVDVLFRVYDCAGNFNDCSLVVTVEDRVLPTLVAPESAEDDCVATMGLDLTDTDVLQDRYGVPVVDDNCPDATFVELTPVNTPMECDGQSILRSFYAIDASGNLSHDTVHQLVIVEGISEFTVLFPENADVDCGEDIPLLEPTVLNVGCGDLFTRYSDIIFNQDEGACFKVIRTWEVIDWCRFNISQTAEDEQVVLTADIEGAPHTVTDGYIKFVQEILITDTEAPTLTNLPQSRVVGVTDDCGATAQIPTIGVLDNNCDGDAEVRILVNGNLTDASSILIGTHGDTYEIAYQAVDGCHNFSDIHTITISFEDQQKPTPICLSLSTELGSGGEVMIWASDFESGSSHDNCQLSSIQLINQVIDRDNDGDFIDDVIQTPPSMDQTAITFDCDDIGNQVVQYWIQDVAGNWEFCVTGIFITDADDDDCDNASTSAQVSGHIQTVDGENIENVEVQVDVPTMPSIFTGFDGLFNFANLTSGESYTFTPIKDEEDANGVSTLDMVILQRHLLGITDLDSPYKLLAADVNESGSISTGDIVELRRLVLGINRELSKTDSWKFVQSNYTFSDPSAPFDEAVPYSAQVDGNAEIDFIGFKMGDLNLNASTGLDGADEHISAIPLEVDNQSIPSQEYFYVSLRASQVMDMYGLGLQIELTDAVELVDVRPGVIDGWEDSMMHIDTDGHVNVAWTDAWANTIDQGSEILVLELKANTDIQVRDVLTLLPAKSSIVIEEGSDILEKRLHLDFKENKLAEFQLYQNYPNPFEDNTTIQFELATADHVTIDVVDISGKVVYQIKSDFPKGLNEVLLSEGDLRDSGVFYYRVQSKDFTATKKLIHIKR